MTDFAPFTCGDSGDWGWINSLTGAVVVRVVGLGGGVIAIDVADEVMARVRQRLPEPNEVTAERGFTRLIYRGHWKS